MSALSLRIVELEEVESTSHTLRKMAMEGSGPGTVVVAQRQTAGKGSGDRRWHSPEGGLYLSILLPPKPPRRPTDLGLVTSVALAQALRNVLPKHKEVSLKWPNDCLVSGKKVAGILSESLEGPFGNQVIVGIGVNVNVKEEDLTLFRERPFRATSLSIEMGGTLDLKEFQSTLLAKILGLYELYKTSGFSPIQMLWENNCTFIGKRVRLDESSVRRHLGEELSGRSVVGTFLGIDDSGGLVLSNAQGERRAYVTGEITCYWP